MGRQWIQFPDAIYHVFARGIEKSDISSILLQR